MLETRDGEIRYASDADTDAKALPAAVAVAALIHLAGLGDIARLSLGGVIHEMGHWSAAILGGRWAFFVPYVLTFVGQDLSVFVAAAVFAAAAWLGRYFYQEGCRGFATLCGLVIVGQVALTLVASADQWRMWTVFWGCGGEVVLSALMVVTYYYRMPDRLRWDFWRWPVFLLGTQCFFENILFWQRVSPDLRELLGGDAVGQSREYDQDMVRLVHDWHWAPGALIAAYRGLCLLGLAAVTLHYAWAAFAPRRAPDAP